MPDRLCTTPYKGCLSLYKSAVWLLQNLRWQQIRVGMTLSHAQSPIRIDEEESDAPGKRARLHSGVSGAPTP
jgi:hypothetical protein